MNALIELFDQAQQLLFEAVLQPAMFALGLGNLLAEGYRATGWLLVGLLQLALLLSLGRALERWRPVEPVSDRAAVRTDVVYTLLHRLGIVRVALFFTLDPLWDAAMGWARLHGWPTLELEMLWPALAAQPLLGFAVYLLLFDLADYFYHRAQHRFGWWWQLHAVHHSQRQLTVWSDDRNHLLDDALHDAVFVLLAMAVGVPPGQFIALVALTQLLQSLAHANLRLDFGPLRGLLVSPRFHRLHHAIGLGHESAGAGSLGGHNFAVLFPVWDVLFGTARWHDALQPTGIRDQLAGRDYGRGFWAQQWRALARIAGRA